jgi:hypothetical protein
MQVVAQEQPDPLCGPLQTFANSVPPGETRELTFHTIWGSNFKDSPEPAVRATRCLHHGDAQAKAVCDYLASSASVEWPGNSVERALACLSPGTRFAKRVDMQQGVFSLSYGSGERGSRLKLVFGEDPSLGGMAFQIVADGY